MILPDLWRRAASRPPCDRSTLNSQCCWQTVPAAVTGCGSGTTSEHTDDGARALLSLLSPVPCRSLCIAACSEWPLSCSGEAGLDWRCLEPEAATSFIFSPSWWHCRPGVAVCRMYFWNFGDSDFLSGLWISLALHTCPSAKSSRKVLGLQSECAMSSLLSHDVIFNTAAFSVWCRLQNCLRSNPSHSQSSEKHCLRF